MIFWFEKKNIGFNSRNNSEKLAAKIREQAAALVQINNEKHRLLQDNEIYQQQIRKLSHELESSHTDKDKIEVRLKPSSISGFFQFRTKIFFNLDPILKKVVFLQLF
jgi:hypothetical protein